MIRGLIVLVDTSGPHVYIPEIHPFGLNPIQYPITPVWRPLQIDSKTGVYQPVRRDSWCWIEFEKDDPHRPVIVGFVSEEQDLPTEDVSQLFSITNDDKGFKWYTTKSGTRMECDGDVGLRIGAGAYESLYSQLNALRAKLDEHEQQLMLLNGHVHVPPNLAPIPMTGPMMPTSSYFPKEFKYIKQFVPL
jgi:hypothetical protein